MSQNVTRCHPPPPAFLKGMNDGGSMTHGPLFFIALALSPGLARAATQPSYEEVSAQAASLADQGQQAQALVLLGGLAAQYPQDPALHVQCGWLASQERAWQEARDWYARALAISPQHYEARLGLAWAHWHMGEAELAQADFATLAAERPGDARALQGLRAARRQSAGLQAGVAGTAYLYPGNPARRYGTGLAVGADGWTGSLVAGASYRGTRFTGSDAQRSPETGPLGPVSATSSSTQHEGWAWAGLARTRWGATLHGARIADLSTEATSAWVLGAMGRFEPLARGWGALLGEASASLYDDLNVLRLSAAWRQPLGRRGLYVQPISALQLADGSPFFSQGLELGYGAERLSLSAGGKLGRETRPTLLGLSLANNLPGTISGGGWAGLGLDVGQSWNASLITEAYRLLDDETQASSWTLATQLGLGRSF